METRIQVEVENLLESIRKLNGNATCADQLITRSVSNVIAGIVLGKRYDHSSPELSDLIEKLHEFVSLSRDRLAVDFLPIMRFLPKYRSGIKESIRVHDAILEHMNSKIDAGLQGELPESFITHFLEMEGPDFDRDQLLFTLRDLYLYSWNRNNSFDPTVGANPSCQSPGNPGKAPHRDRFRCSEG